MTSKIIYKKIYKELNNMNDRSARIFMTHSLTLCVLVYLKIASDEIHDIKWFKNEMEKQDFIKMSFIFQNYYEKQTPENWNKLCEIIRQIFTIEHQFEAINKIYELYCDIYFKHKELRKFYFFYEKKYDDVENQNSILKFSEIMLMIGQLNRFLKEIINDDYASIIKYAKLSFMEIKNVK